MLIKNVALLHTTSFYPKIYGYRLHATQSTDSLVAITKLCTHYTQLRTGCGFMMFTLYMKVF